MKTKRFTFKANKRATVTIGIDAPTLAKAATIYRRLRPDDRIALVTTDPSKGLSRLVWLVPQRKNKH